MKKISLLYFSPSSFFFWTNRFVYIGIIASALYFYDKFVGQFNLIYPVDPQLVNIAIGGLLFYEIGVRIGFANESKHLDSTKANWLRSSSIVTPLTIWVIALIFSIVLFELQGVPALTDPMNRANLGPGLGVLKRFMQVLMPMAGVEIVVFSIYQKRYLAIASLVVLGTLAILFLLTFKAFLFFFVIYLVIAYYLVNPGKYRFGIFRMINLRTLLLLTLLAGVVYLYAEFVLPDFFETMLIRTTNLIAQAPNYIVSGLPGVPSGSELVSNEIASVLQTLHLPLLGEARAFDTELTNIMLGYYIPAGGLVPTVIGYGWILGEWAGVLILSCIYGYLSGIFVGRLNNATTPITISVYMFAAFTVFSALEVFSPVGAFLDTGLSIVVYIVLHRFLEGFSKKKPDLALSHKARLRQGGLPNPNP